MSFVFTPAPSHVPARYKSQNKKSKIHNINELTI